MEKHPCPKCNAPCEACGELETPEGTYPVYQCDVCTIPWDFDGAMFEAAFTFALRPDQTWFDPGKMANPGMN